jgi:hypothetical protein
MWMNKFIGILIAINQKAPKDITEGILFHCTWMIFKEMFTLARCRENDIFDSVGLSYLYGENC